MRRPRLLLEHVCHLRLLRLANDLPHKPEALPHVRALPIAFAAQRNPNPAHPDRPPRYISRHP